MGSPWEKTVDVTLESVSPLKYSIVPTGTHPLPSQNGMLVFDNDHHDGFNVHFNLIDKTGGNYRWPPNNLKDQAVWSKVGTSDKCPGSPSKEVFHAVSVDNQTRKVLTVNNPNPKPAQGAFQYTLCVTNNDGKTYLPLDPGGLNNNGPRSAQLLSPTTVFVALVGAAIGATIALSGQAAENSRNVGLYAGIGAIAALAVYFVVRSFRERAA